jgi:hypothetical protein
VKPQLGSEKRHCLETRNHSLCLSQREVFQSVARDFSVATASGALCVTIGISVESFDLAKTALARAGNCRRLGGRRNRKLKCGTLFGQAEVFTDPFFC